MAMWNKYAYGNKNNNVSRFKPMERSCIVCGKNIAVKGKYCPSCAIFLRKAIQREAK